MRKLKLSAEEIRALKESREKYKAAAKSGDPVANSGHMTAKPVRRYLTFKEFMAPKKEQGL